MKLFCFFGVHGWNFRLLSVNPPIAKNECRRCGHWHYVTGDDGLWPRSNPPST